MYTVEEREKAIQMYIESGKNEGVVIRTLGYASPNTLRAWYSAYMQLGCLHEHSTQKPRHTQAQIDAAIGLYAAHTLSLTQTCRALGYPTRAILRNWIKEGAPQLLKPQRHACKSTSALAARQIIQLARDSLEASRMRCFTAAHG